MSLLWINGQLIDKADAKISPFDHGFLYGDGVWEPIRAFRGRPFLLSHHLDLLFAACESQCIVSPYSRDELSAAIEATLRANNRTEGYVRVIVSRGAGALGPDPRKIDTQVIIIAEEYQPFPLALYEHGLHAVTVPVPNHGLRTLGQPHIALAKYRALESGCLEAILVNQEDKLVGTTEGFLFLVEAGALVTAAGQPTEATGFAIAAMAGESLAVVAEYAVGIDNLYSAEEALIAGTSCGVIGIVRVDGKDIGTGAEGPVTRAIRERYHVLTRGG